MRGSDKTTFEPMVLDLFCGAGGFSYGFGGAGFRIVAGIDNWNDAITTYRHNFPDTKTLNDDIEKIKISDIDRLLDTNPPSVDIIIGGPPCQGFSVSGKRFIDDPRNKLYKTFVSLVKHYKPKMFLMENVPGIMRLFNGQVKEQIIKGFTGIGYIVNSALLSAADYGVPQQRKRIFFVGINPNKIKNTQTFTFPVPTNGSDDKLNPYVTVKDAISDLDFIPDDITYDECIEYELPPANDYQKSIRKGSKHLYNHVATLHTKRTKEIIAMVPDGGNYKCLPEELWNTRKVNIAWTRMNSNKPCFTIDTGHNHHFHYKENRVPTVRESARIQSFPDTFLFFGIKTSQLRQVGNAVPPLLAKAIAKKVYSVLQKG